VCSRHDGWHHTEISLSRQFRLLCLPSLHRESNILTISITRLLGKKGEKERPERHCFAC
jgi:hypothetical protein